MTKVFDSNWFFSVGKKAVREGPAFVRARMLIAACRALEEVDRYVLSYCTKKPSLKSEKNMLSTIDSAYAIPWIRLSFSLHNIDVVDMNGNTPLLLAASEGRLVLVIALLRQGANLNHVNNNGLTALMIAIIENHFAVFHYLLMQGSNIFLHSLSGNNAIQWAAAYSRIKMLNVLIESQEIDLNAHREEGYTLLMNAVVANKIEVVKWLLARGARLDEFNNNGESAITLAYELKRTNIYDYLKGAVSSGTKVYNKRTRKLQSLTKLRFSLSRLHYQMRKVLEEGKAQKKVFHCKQTAKHDETAYLSIVVESTPEGKQKKKKRKCRNHNLAASLDGAGSTNPILGLPVEAQLAGATRRHVVDRQEPIAGLSSGLVSGSLVPTEEAAIIRPAAAQDSTVLERAGTRSIPGLSGKTSVSESSATKPHATVPEYLVPDAIQQVMSKIESLGFEVYLVGGCIRDFLMGVPISDFDLVCSAPPQVVGQHVGVGTFSKHIPNLYKIWLTGMHIDLLCKSDFDLVVDARQRDFTCNALYADRGGNILDPLDGTGLSDIAQKQLVVIGDPVERFEQDAIRLLRLARLVATRQFTVSDKLLEIVRKSGHFLRDCLPGRIQSQMRKLFLDGSAVDNYNALKRLGLLPSLFTQMPPALFSENSFNRWVINKLAQTDLMVQLMQPVSIYYILAMFKGAFFGSEQQTSLSHVSFVSGGCSKEYQIFKEVDTLASQIIREARAV